MTIFQSIFLGIVQGVTEFLPVSSSGHLAILENIFHIETDGGLLFNILLHLATLFVIILVYRRDIWKMICETVFMIGDIFKNLWLFILNLRYRTTFKYKKIVSGSYRKFVLLILVSTIPTAVIGYLGEKFISDASDTLLIPGICLLITAVLLLMADTVNEGHRLPQNTDYKSALIIGTAQGCATLPGLSRSGTTIAACMLLGLDRRFAVKYSFILSIPAICGAAVLEVRDVIAEPAAAGSQVGIYLAGMAAAAVVGYICIKTMLVIVRKKKFIYFSVYCAIVGLLAIAGRFLL